MMLDTTLASVEKRDDREGRPALVRKFPKRGFALGVIVALPVSLLLWRAIFWVALR